MEYVIGILLYNNFVELPDQAKHFVKTKDSFNSLRVPQAERKEHVTSCVASENLRKFKGKSKENSVNVGNCTTRKRFLLFFLKIAQYQKCVSYFQTKELQSSLGFVSATNRAHRLKAKA